MFEDLGLKYMGPVDGHDLAALEHALERAKAFGGPVIVHAVTRKGNGYAPAENDEADQMHQTDPMDPATGAPTGVKKRGWTSVFADELVRDRRRTRRTWSPSRPRCSARPAWTSSPTRIPDRCFDVGIAEQHAITSAAGMAMGGLHPVVAHLLDVPQPRVRPAADGRGAAPPAGHASSWTGPASPARTAPATTACGTCRSSA